MRFDFLAILLFIGSSVFSQTINIPTHRTCQTMEHHMELIGNRPSIIQEKASTEQKIKKWIENNPGSLNERTTYTIPVVFHVVYKTEDQNVSDDLIYAQLQQMNDDFKALNADIGNVPDEFSSLIGNVDIEFCLSELDPAGNPTSGIHRVGTSVSQFAMIGDHVKHTSQGGTDAWDPSQYLNIWICNLSPTILGYAQLPFDYSSSPNTDGVVLAHYTIGALGTPNPNGGNYGKGRTATHEIGHSLGLYHIWGDGECEADDEVSDTPFAIDSYTGCPNHPSESCGTNDMFMNYMDYVQDDCMNMFTNGQAARIVSFINNYEYLQNRIAASDIICNYVPQAPMPSLSSDLRSGCPGIEIQFTDNSSFNPTIWNWSFPGGNPSSSSLQNPMISYDVEGIYNVSLTVSNAFGTNSITQNAYVEISNSSIQALYMEDFENNGNWTVINPDNATTWEVSTAWNGISESKAVKMDNYNYEAEGQRDRLVSPVLDFSDNSYLQLDFDYAHRRKSQEKADSLIIYVSDNAGGTWSRVFADAENGSGNFETNTLSPQEFVPNSVEDWCFEGIVGNSCISIDLSAYDGAAEFMVMFENVNDFGNNIYIDNIKISGSCEDPASPQKPNALFSITTINKGCESIQIQYFDNSTKDPTSWFWSFPGGEPSVSTEQNPIVNYMASGIYDASLTVNNDIGSDSLTQNGVVIVPEAIIVSASVSATNVGIGEELNFVDNTIGATTWNWNFNDGTSSTEQNPSHIYTAPGIYNVLLIVTDGFCTETAFITIEVTSLVGTQDIKGLHDFRIYPNPVLDEINITLTTDKGLALELSMEIFDMLGNRVFETEHLLLNGNINENFQVDHLSVGTYFIRITDGIDSVTSRFLKY